MTTAERQAEQIDAINRDRHMRGEKMIPPQCYNCTRRASVTIGTGNGHFIYACRGDQIDFFIKYGGREGRR